MYIYIYICIYGYIDIFMPPERPPHPGIARAQPHEAHLRRHSRPHHHRNGEHSPTARQPHSNGLCSLPKEGIGNLTMTD